MKKIVYLVLSGFIVMFLVLFCENDNHNQNITGGLVKNSACKSKSEVSNTGIPSDQSCITYAFEKSTGKLSVKHINAAFNCCPGDLTCTVKLSGDTIIIQESEEKAMCNCDCLFDLDIEATGVTSGKYQVKFVEPYSGNQEKIVFEIDLVNKPEGTFCATRNKYPWGI